MLLSTKYFGRENTIIVENPNILLDKTHNHEAGSYLCPGITEEINS